ncbi:MAG: hypothetical protein ACRDZP_05280, partial [Acidimicrobiales bacterium]
MTPLIAGLLGAALGFGVLVLVVGLRRRSPHLVSHRTNRRNATGSRSGPARRLDGWRSVLPVLVGVAALLVTRWPMALPLGALAVLGMRALGSGASGASIESLEAMASWTEMLR